MILRAYFDISRHEEVKTLKIIAEKNHKDRLTTQDPPAKNLGSTVNVDGNYRGWVGFILRITRRLLMLLHIRGEKSIYLQKMIMCICFGHLSVSKYISSKRLTCFIWKDKAADVAYPKYINMLKKIFPYVSEEIEVLE